MKKNTKLWLVLFALVAGLVAIGQGCGLSSSDGKRTIYGTTS